MRCRFATDLILQLPCPANQRNDDQRDGEWNEEFGIAIAGRADVIQFGDGVVERTDIPDDQIKNLKEFAGSLHTSDANASEGMKIEPEITANRVVMDNGTYVAMLIGRKLRG